MHITLVKWKTENGICSPFSGSQQSTTLASSINLSMWTCPRCERKFKTRNQSHSCEKKDIGELFLDKSDGLVLAFDEIMSRVMEWQPNSVGAAKHAVVFTNKKAWLIIKPMTKELDVKFYYPERLESDELKKVTSFGKKFAHHIRIKHEFEVNDEIMQLLRVGYDYAME